MFRLVESHCSSTKFGRDTISVHDSFHDAFKGLILYSERYLHRINPIYLIVDEQELKYYIDGTGDGFDTNPSLLEALPLSLLEKMLHITRRQHGNSYSRVITLEEKIKQRIIDGDA